MAIRYTCRCGANIRMPVSAAGKRARCTACGVVFTVPTPDYDPDTQPIPLEGSEPTKPTDQREEPSPGGLLAEFAKEEKQSGNSGPVMVMDLAPDPRVVEQQAATAAQEQARTALPRITPRMPHEDAKLFDADRSGVVGPELPFWQDLLSSFVFFLDPSNLIAYLLMGMLPFGLYFIPIAGMVLMLIVQLYIFGFFMAIVRETAAGEDRLPEVVWMSGPFDLVMPLVHFLGVTALAMLPAAIYVAVSFEGQDIWDAVSHVLDAPRLPAVQALTVLGLLFWPVMILAVAIGGSLRGLWPHLIVRTVISAPIPYLAICGILIFAAALWYFPHGALFRELAKKFAPGAKAAVILASDMISLYAMIVGMRTIGLFYRHYKHKFPWVAE